MFVQLPVGDIVIFKGQRRPVGWFGNHGLLPVIIMGAVAATSFPALLENTIVAAETQCAAGKCPRDFLPACFCVDKQGILTYFHGSRL
jgi:hypothetical protein